MFLFYTPNIATEHFLSEEESAHCVRVLRLTTGDNILLTDGKGTTYEARIINPNPRRCEFDILSSERQQKTWNYRLHIAIAPTKNADRLEWMVEKCTEIGIDEITPLLCRFSERKKVNLDRLQRVMVSAAKQSLKAYMPQLNPMTDYNTFIRQATEQQRFIAHCYKDDKTQLANAVEISDFRFQNLEFRSEHGTFPNSILILIGPEGDFSEQEVQDALSLGFQPVALGNERLRTETAGVVACHTVAVKALIAGNQ